MPAPTATLVELRVLEGPNLYFPRPAIKLTIGVEPLLGFDERRFAAIAARLDDHGRPGSPGTEHRRRATARLAADALKRLAQATDVRLGVRSRPGARPDEVVVAYPWRRLGTAEAAGREVPGILDVVTARRSLRRALAAAAERVLAADPGEEPAVPDPDIPVVSVTGTNGKTSTVRLLAHLVRTAGRSVAYSSTDGVYRGDDELVEDGDYSGFAGASLALAQHPDVAVLETARGGILLRGVGVAHNDVAVVTNVSEDHLGLHGIRTVDQLAEVKATITRITRPDGWDVLNADDPRVLAMQRVATGRTWLCSNDHDHPAIREALARGGRATAPLDGRIAVFEGRVARPLVPLLDVPMTIAGISSSNVMNAMQAASAALAVGIPERAVVRGLRTFVLDAARNPGRANLFEIDGRVVVVDYAHNEAGMAGLIEIARGLRRRGRDVWVAICTAGDRTDEILHRFAYRAARGADHVAIAELHRYLRGRDPEDVISRLLEGALEAGKDDVEVYPDELAALQALLGKAERGDVVAVTALAMRAEVFAWLEEHGGRPLSPGEVRRIVANARRRAARR
ncbi:MAG TPA: Mur ligase family protein [Actinomycetota bacterium]|nr:Mur ligase family protein [Actinomycetota bacterium]